MDFAKGGPVKLRNNGLDPQDVALVLERLEVAMPHLHFNKWKVTDHQEDDAPIGEVKWKSNDRLQVEARLDVQNNIRIWTICERDFGAVALDDYEFLLNLVDEAAALIGTSLTGAMSLFEFGTNAIAAEVQRLLNMEENPVAVLRFVRSLALETYENQRLSYGLIFSPKSEGSSQIAEAFDNKRAKRLTDGFSTALILDVNSRIADYAALNLPPQEGLHLSRRPWWTAGLAETAHRLEGAGIALLRCGDMLVMHNNRLAYSQRAGHWRVWRHSAILARLESKWTGKGNPGEVNSVLRYLYHVALDLSFRRSGGLLVVVFSKTRISDIRVLLKTTTNKPPDLRNERSSAT